MDINYHHALALVAPVLTQRRASDTMPGNRGVSSWHKKIHGKPKNVPSSLKIGVDDPKVTTEDSSDYRRHYGWRSTLQGSRPAIPVSVIPTTPVTEDRSDRSETDARSDRSEASTPHPSSRPKAARYTSIFNNIKEASREPEFSEPWSEDTPPSYQLAIDPIIALQSVYSHMLRNTSKPIPQEYHSGLFRIFEDYRKSKSENEQLKSILDDTCRNWETAEKHWASSERELKTDIHRLEMLMARGASSVAGDTKCNRKTPPNLQRKHRKTISTDRLLSTVDIFSCEQTDEKHRLKAEQSTLPRQIRYQNKSPSGKMAALSQRYIGTGSTHLPVGAPPNTNRKMTLSRQVQSELNLARMGQIEDSQPVSDCMNSSFPEIGNRLLEEVTAHETTQVGSAAECEVFAELRELGKLIALRRGLKTDDFVNGLMKLFSETSVEQHNQGSNEHSNEERQLQRTPLRDDDVHHKLCIEEDLASKPTLRRFQSQPQLSSDQKRCRRFSFEFGDDHLQTLEEKFFLHDASQDASDSSDSDSQISIRESQLGDKKHSLQALCVEQQKPSKIPSPVQTIGRVRQKKSDSSLQSVFTRSNQDLRRDSRSSILTAFRDSPSGHVQPMKGRSGSIGNPSISESTIEPKDQVNEVGAGNNIVFKAAESHGD